MPEKPKTKILPSHRCSCVKGAISSGKIKYEKKRYEEERFCEDLQSKQVLAPVRVWRTHLDNSWHYGVIVRQS